VDAVLEQIRRTEPLLAGRLFEDDGSVRGFINVFVDGTELRHLEAGRRQVRPGSVVAIVPSVAGG
jgi:molybdopterin converting factor small subunit